MSRKFALSNSLSACSAVNLGSLGNIYLQGGSQYLFTQTIPLLFFGERFQIKRYRFLYVYEYFVEGISLGMASFHFRAKRIIPIFVLLNDYADFHFIFFGFAIRRWLPGNPYHGPGREEEDAHVHSPPQRGNAYAGSIRLRRRYKP